MTPAFVPAPAAVAACRPGCAACCIAPSISSPIPGRDGAPAAPKPAGVPCWQLDEHLRCRLFGRPERPAVCLSLAPSREMCGDTPAQAMRWLTRLERQTTPACRSASRLSAAAPPPARAG